LWKAARLRLEQCKTLIIVGYSLPETDLLAKALFAEVIRTPKARKHYVKQLHLADPNDSVKQKLIELFVPALNAHSKIFRYRDIRELASAWSPAYFCFQITPPQHHVLRGDITMNDAL
jgi:hypothetical protein